MQLDDNFFAQLGLKLNDEQKDLMAENLAAELEGRVGGQLADRVTDERYGELELLMLNGTEGELEQWLQENVPGYGQLVEETLEKLKQEAIANPDKFLKTEL